MREQISFGCDAHPDLADCPDALVAYSARFDDYGLRIHDGGGAVVSISHCPWCGARLPRSRRAEWFRRLEELGFEDPLSQEVPADYMTSRWWQADDAGYPTCRTTHATLRAFSPSVPAERVTKLLDIEPTNTHAVGDPIGAGGRGARKQHGWFLSTEERVSSSDTRQHIDWLLDRLEPAREGHAQLVGEGVVFDLFSYWESAKGHGGPMLEPSQMRRLAELGLVCGWDVYFSES